MPKGRRKSVVRDILKDVVEKPVEMEVEVSEVKDEKAPVEQSFSFSIPADKVPIQLKEMPVNSEVTIQITGNISSSDETGVLIDIKTIEVV